MRVLVTGGAGFIGSHLVDSLMLDGDSEVVVLDNLSSGGLHNLARWKDDARFRFVRGDLKNKDDLGRSLEEVEFVYHLAANPEVRVGETDPSIHFDENLVATFNLLEEMRRRKVGKIVFSSTSTVYGETAVLPTPEEYGPVLPISTYGASKLGCEALISSYAYTFGLRGLILRMANIVGGRSMHGAVVDFVRKLRQNPAELEILGDGSQKKSYLHVDDCVSAIRRISDAFLKTASRVDVYNIGSADVVSVGRIGQIVAEEMGLRNVRFKFTGGIDGGRGWLGDVKEMQLSIDKLLRTGWKPRLNGEEAVRVAALEILRDATLS